MSILDVIPDELLYEQYADPLGGIGKLAAAYGVSSTVMYRRLNADPQQFMDAQATRAFRLHELAVSSLYEEPERIVDAQGNERIDPSSVALLKYRSSEASRIAGILYQKLSERHQVDVMHNASPLADYIASIAAKGSTIPIAAQHMGRVIEGEIIEAGDIEPQEQGGSMLL
ncbi:MAG: hypothetical protein WC736_14700 [Gallionella sp.]|jgi:hypothetical protein